MYHVHTRSAGIVQAGRQGFDSWQRQEICLYSTASRPPLGPTPPPIHWVPRVHSLGVRRPGLEADLYLVSNSRMVELYLHSPMHPIHSAQGQLYLYLRHACRLLALSYVSLFSPNWFSQHPTCVAPVGAHPLRLLTVNMGPEVTHPFVGSVAH
jgi:hypothetical protein